MRCSDAQTAVEVVGRCDVEELDDRDELAAVMGDIRRLRAWLDAIEVRCTRRARALAEAGRAEAPEWLHVGAGGRSSHDAGRVTERERTCAASSKFEAALATGEITAGHVDAIGAALRGANAEVADAFAAQEASLLAVARRSGVDSFSRHVRRTVRTLQAASTSAEDPEVAELDAQRARANVKRWTDKITGMCHTRLELDPVRDAEFWTAVNAHLARLRHRDPNSHLRWSELQADAVVAAVSTPAAGDTDRSGQGRGPRIPRLIALVDHQTLIDGLHARGVCETSAGRALPVATLRRMACDAEILPAVLDGTGRVLDVGRARRTVTADQRTALRAMYATCGIHDCTVPFDDCHIHHVRWWSNGGGTDLDNLVPVCSRDHRRLHEGGWTLTITPDRITTLTRPDRTIHHQGPSINRTSGGITSPPVTREWVAHETTGNHHETQSARRHTGASVIGIP